MKSGTWVIIVGCESDKKHQLLKEMANFSQLVNARYMSFQSRVGFVVINIWLIFIQQWALFSSKLWQNIAGIQGKYSKYGNS